MTRLVRGEQDSDTMSDWLPTIASYFWRLALEHPDRPALHIPGNGTNASRCFATLSWRDLAIVVQETIVDLESTMDAGSDSTPPRILTVLPNSLTWIAIDLAAQTLGVPHVAVDRRESARRIERLRQKLAPTRFIDTEAPKHLLLIDIKGKRQGTSPPAHLKRQGASPPAVSAIHLQQRHLQQRQAQSDSQLQNDCAQILITSGTTSEPKCVQLSHQNLVSNAWAKLEAAPQFASDRRLNLLPFSHAYARTCELSTWILTGGELCLARSWDDAVFVARELDPTLINLVPYLADKLASLLESDRNAMGEQLRLVQVGGAGLSDRTWERLNRIGLPPLQGYGLTEASPVVCSNRSGVQQRGTVGPPVSNVDIRIDDDGVLWVRGPNVMLGYVDEPPIDNQALPQGWLSTGDLAEYADDGHIRIIGRASEQIVLSTGYKLSPLPMESLVLEQLADENIRVVVLGNGFAAPGIVIDWMQEPPAREMTGTSEANVLDARIYFGGLLCVRNSSENRSIPGRITDKPSGISENDWTILHPMVTHWRERLEAIDWSDFPRYARPLWWGFMIRACERIPDGLTMKGTLRRKAIESSLEREIATCYLRAAPTEVRD